MTTSRLATGVATQTNGVIAHTRHGAVHTAEGWVSVALLGLAGAVVLAGVGRLYTTDAVSVWGATVGGTIGLVLLVAAGLLVWPVV